MICQLRFPSILSIATEPPARFQELVRSEYPIYERDSGLALQLPDPATFSLPNPVDAVTHRFFTRDRSRQISLAPTFLALSEGSYTEWPHFRSQLEDALHALTQVYEPAFLSRVGLRYMDVIDRDLLGLRDHPWSELLNDRLTGFLADSNLREFLSQVHTTSLLEADSPDGNVRIQHGLAQKDDRVVYVIDADFFIEETISRDDLSPALDRFNLDAGYMFRWAIKPILRDALGVRNGSDDERVSTASSHSVR